MPKPRLNIRRLSVPAHLGCSPEERKSLQEVRFTVKMQFPSSPPGEKTDRLEDTLCYGEVCETLRNFVTGRKFHLVEKMAGDCLSILREKYPSMTIRLTLHKVTPPIEGLKGGIKYTCGEMF